MLHIDSLLPSVRFCKRLISEAILSDKSVDINRWDPFNVQRMVSFRNQFNSTRCFGQYLESVGDDRVTVRTIIAAFDVSSHSDAILLPTLESGYVEAKPRSRYRACLKNVRSIYIY